MKGGMDLSNLSENLLERRAFLVGLVDQLGSALNCAPKGKLRINHKNGRAQYYLREASNDKVGRYLKKGELPTAAAIAQRDYNEAALEAAVKELACIDKLLGVRDLC